MPGDRRSTTAPSLIRARYWLLVAGIIAIAALLRIVFLGTKSFDVDESASVTYARLGWTAFLSAVSRDANMSLYYVLLRLWAQLGDSEAMLRSLSVIPAVATLPAVYALGTRLFGRDVGLIALVLLCVNAFHIAYAQNARGYSLLVLLITLSSLFFVRGIERRSWQDWTGYVLTSVLSVYSHLFAGLALIAQWVSVVFLPTRQVPWKALSISILLTASLSLPMGVFVLTSYKIHANSIPRPNLKDVVGLFFDLAGGADPKEILLRAPLAAYLIVCLMAVAAAARLWASRQASRGAWHYGFVLTWLWVPILLALAISAVKPIFLRRYLIVCLPSLMLLAAVGLSQIRPRWVLAGAMAVFIGLALHGDYYYYADTPYETQDEDYRAATRYVLDHAEPGDAVLFYDEEIKIPFSYYRGRFRDLASRPSITILSERARRDLPPKYSRVWILSNDKLKTRQSIQAWMANRDTAIMERQFLGVRVLLYRKYNQE